jgi:4-amino-4-deoxy-L-arabinose transferase-like glycosyltransferase
LTTELSHVHPSRAVISNLSGQSLTVQRSGGIVLPVRLLGWRPRGALLRSRTLVDLSAITGLWLLQTVLANPAGEFPLNDDWSYSQSVQALVSQGRFGLTDFTAMPLIAQVLWGSLFCLPFGFSFTALRLSTWVLGLLGLVATYGLLRTLGASRSLVLLATVLLAINPLYFALSLTFMTDVPFLTLSVASLALLINGLRTGDRRHMTLGFVFAFLALLIRQLAAAIPISFGLAYLFVHGFSRRTIFFAALPTVSALGLLRIYQSLIRWTIGLPLLYNRPYDPILESTPLSAGPIVLELVGRTVTELVYAGLFVLPLALVVAASRWRRFPGTSRLWMTCTALAVLPVMLGWHLSAARLMPLSGNVLYNVGLGPPLLRDVYLLRLPHLPQAPPAFWFGVTLAGVVGASLLVEQALVAVAGLGWRATSSGRARAAVPIVVAASASLMYVGFAAVVGFLDRYLIWLLPLLMVCVLAALAPRHLDGNRWVTYAARALVVGYSAFSIAAAHDYFAWNRSRWEALTYLTQVLHVPTNEVDGGFEFNGWYDYDRNYRERAGVSWWWVQADNYIVAFGPLDGYREMLRYPYDRWLPPGHGDISVLRKLDQADARPHGGAE